MKSWVKNTSPAALRATPTPVRPYGPSMFSRGGRLAMALVGCDVLGAPLARHHATKRVDTVGEAVVSEGRPAVRHGEAVQPRLLGNARIEGERGETAGAPVPVHQLAGCAFEPG